MSDTADILGPIWHDPGYQDQARRIHQAMGYDYDAPPLDGAPPADTDPEPLGATWAPVDLTDTLRGLQDGTLTRPEPTVAHIADGMALFYPGRVNGIHGDSNAGKTWTALAACAQELAAGRKVVYIDLEDNPAGLVGRLLAIGVRADDIATGLSYVHPDERLDDIARTLLYEHVKRKAPTLVVIDSTGEALALEGANPNADEEVARWFRRLPRMLADLGPAVVTCDHMTKADAGDALWPIGSQRKRAAVTGAQYLQKIVRPFSRDTAGHAVLVCAKDRNGLYSAGQKVAELHVVPDGDATEVSLRAVADDSAGGRFRPTVLMERVSRVLELVGSEGLSVRGIERRVTGKKDAVAQAVDVLAAEGYLTKTRGPRNALIHTTTKPYREESDPGPDSHQSGGGRSTSEMTPNECLTVPVPIGGGTGGQSNDRPRGTVGGRSGTVVSPGPGTTQGPVGTSPRCAQCGQPPDDSTIGIGAGGLCLTCETVTP